MKEQIRQKDALLIFVVMLLICGGHSIGYAHNTGTLHFESASTTRSVVENTGTGQNIGTAVEATAASVTDTLTYTLSGTDAASFDIVSTSGQLQTKGTLDYETKNEYSVTVGVSDGADTASITVTINVTDVNETLAFPDTTDTTLEITQYIAVGADIGMPISAADRDTADGDTDVNPTDVNVDVLTYTLSGTDAESFDFDTGTGQLTAKDGVTFDRSEKNEYSVTVSASDGEFTVSITVTINVVMTSVCDRTSNLQTPIIIAVQSSYGNFFPCDELTEAHLATVTSLDVSSRNINALKAGDFEGFTALTALELDLNNLTEVPPEIFDGLTALTDLYLEHNYLSELPAGIFEGLTALELLQVDGNTVDPLPMTVSLKKVAEGEFKAMVHTGAPFDIVLPVSATNGTIDGGATTITISQGSVESTSSLTVTRTPGTAAAVTVNIGTPPSLPEDHDGYELVKSTDVPPAVSDALPFITATVAENTASGEDIDPRILVTPADSSGTLTYSLSGTDAASFDIDSTGQLKTKAGLDYETKNSYAVVVTVSDGTNDATIDVTINVTDVNEAPTFPDGITRTVTEDMGVGANIGMPISASDPDTADGDADVNPTDDNVDTLTYTLSGTDAASFDIDAGTGQLKTKAGVTFDRHMKDDYSVTVTASDGELSVSTPVLIAVVGDITPVCDRTVQVRDAIVAAVDGVTDCADVTAVHLIAITRLDISEKGINALQSGDFSGLTSLTYLDLYRNARGGLTTIPVGMCRDLAQLDFLHLGSNGLTEIPVGAFDGLTNIRMLRLDANDFTTLPEKVFNGLNPNVSQINFSHGELIELPEKVFSGLTGLETILLLNNELTEVPADLYDGLALTGIHLQRNKLTEVPADLFDGLNSLVYIHLFDNMLSTLPDGIFEGLTAAKRFHLQGNTVDPLPLTVSLKKVAEGEFKAMAHTGATFDIVLPVSATNGTIDDSATTITIPKGSVESTSSLTVTRTEGTTDPVTVDIGTLPGLPTDHQGYELVKSGVSPLAAIGNNVPTFTDGDSTTRSIAENTAAGENIGAEIAATDADPSDTLTYSLSGTTDAPNDYEAFSIVTTSGQLQTKTGVTLDYEAKSSYEVSVGVSDGDGATDSITVTIEITNVNEAPILTDDDETDDNTVSRDVLEDATVSTNIGDPVAAVDPDLTATNTDANPETPDADTVSYTLGGTDVASFDFDTATGQLKTKSGVTFDRSVKDEYSVTVTASDGTLSDTINVNINITEVANNVPTFNTGLNTTPSIAENTAAGTDIGDPLTATDLDITDTLTYSIDATDDAVFDIESTSGQLKTEAALDYEDTDSYTVTVTVSDGTGTATIDVTITITNVNEAPAFPPTTDTTLEIAENTAASTNIGAAVAATDPDIAGTNTDANPETSDADTVTYTLTGTDAASFSIDTTSGQLQTKAALDYETKNSYTVTVGASDGTLSNTVDVSIDITNVNEAPTFPPATGTTLEIAENTATNTDLGDAFTATGFDATKHDRYILEGDDAASFSIGSSTGQLTTSAELDYETKSSYTVIVTVQRGIEVGGVATYPDDVDANSVTVTISITDVNEAPVFPDSTDTTLEVTANIAVGADIGMPISASDPDTADGDTDVNPTDDNVDVLTYTLSGTDAASFDFDTGTGQLKTKTGVTFDRSVKDEYSVTVTASDGELSVSTTVTISVVKVITPVCDRTPQVRDAIVAAVSGVTDCADVTETHLAAILSLALASKSISALKAGDFDGLALITLTLNGNQLSTLPEAVFEELTVLATLRLDGNQLTELDAEVFDGLTRLQTLSLATNQLTELPSDVFEGLTALRTLSLNSNQFAELDASLFKGLTALRGLHLNNNQLSALPDEVFKGLTVLDILKLAGNTVDPLPLTVSLKKVADGEFKATVHTGAPFAIVLPVSATTGTIDGSATDITIPKGSVESTTSLTVTRTSGTTDPVTVDIGTLPGLAANHDGYALVKSATLPLAVIPAVGNNAPVFPVTTDTTLEIAENTAAATNIGTVVEATDADTTDTLTYSLSGTTSAPNDYESFSIVTTSGQLQTKAALDYETKSSYEVSVDVSDGNGGTASITVTISITNVNEAPEFATDTATRSIAENTAANANIGDAVAATDPDIAGTNTDANPETSDADTLTYTLGGTDAASFDIVSTSGQLQTKAALDYETEDSYVVTVGVSDGTLTDSIEVTIDVDNVNEAPTFPPATDTTLEIAENTVANTNIGTAVTATGFDATKHDRYILEGDDAASFSIGSSTGQLTTSAALNYETKSSYSVIVTVQRGIEVGGVATYPEGVDANSITVTIGITDVNEAPVFPDTTNTMLEVTANIAVGADIGMPISASDPDTADGDTDVNPTDVNVDVLTYTLSGTDAASFDFDTGTGQLKTKTGVTFDHSVKDEYSVTVTVSDGEFSASTPVVISVVSVITLVCDRTPQVRDAIVAAVAGVTDCADVTEAHLAAITILNVADKGATTLQSGDFDGLTSMTILRLQQNMLTELPVHLFDGLTSLENINLRDNSLTELPEEVFDGLTNLDRVLLHGNRLTELPEEVFDGLQLTRLTLHGNRLTELPEEVFDGLQLTHLQLDDNRLTELPEEVFDGLTALTNLQLQDNRLTELPEEVFDGLTALTNLQLQDNMLSALPAGIFEGLTALTTLFLNGNTVNPLPLTVSLKKVAEGEFKAMVHTGAPFEIVLPVSATNGTIDDSATTITIPKGSVESTSSLTVTRTEGTTDPVTVDISTLPGGLPLDHNGYELVKSGVLPLSVIGNNVPTFTEGDSTIRSIVENTAAGENIGAAVKATDPDPSDTLTYTLSSTTDAPNDYEAFSIVTTSGQLQTKAALDYETKSSYEMTVGVSDGNGGTASITVTINIPNVNEAPAFTTETTTRYVVENASAGRNIGAPVVAVDPDLTATNTDANPETPDADTVTYTLGGTDVASFDFDTRTGQLKTKSGVTFDRSVKDEYSVTVAASDGTLSGSIEVTISITEEGQNTAPTFTDGASTTRSVAENTAASTNIGTVVEATDADAGSTLTYSLSGTTDAPNDYEAFSIVTTSGQLQTKAALNYETKSSYEVSVDVSDGNDGTASITVTINITDVNEAPIFPDTTDTTLEVPEYIAVGANIGAPVAATDPDTADGDTDVNPTNDSAHSLIYSLGGRDAASFDFDTGTAQLQAKEGVAFDRTMKSSYTVLVVAVDGEFTVNTPVTITVIVTPVCDRTEQVKNAIVAAVPGVTDCADVTEPHLAAITNLGLSRQSITTLKPADFDGLTAMTTLALHQNSLSTLPVVLFHELTALTSLNLGYNQLTELDTDIFDGLTALKDLWLNDNELTELDADIFDGLTKLEDITLANNVLTALPEEVFDGLTAMKNLTLSNNQLSALDAELFDGLSALTTLDLSDNKFSTLETELFDDLTALTTLDLSDNQLSALDAELFDGLTALEDLNLSVQYDDMSNKTLAALPAELFDGLTALTTLNLSDNKLSTLEVELFDGLSALTTLNLYSNELSTLPSGIFDGLTALTTLDLSGNTVDPLPLTVSLDKVADAEFKGTALAGAPFAIELPVSATNGTIDNSVTAITIPIGSLESSSVTVTRTSGTTDPVTVDIGVLPSLPANHQGYELVKSDDLPLTVIDAVGNNVPVFDTGLNTTPSIAENTVSGTNIGTPLTAIDADTEDTLTYSIDATSDAVFDIESTSGQLKTEAALDYEDTDSYTVTVTVSDGTNDATIDVTISITNVNEAPEFASDTATRTIAENTAANTNIGDAVAATDPDIAGTNTDANPETSDADALTYTLTGTDAASFGFDTATGQLQTKAALDYETKDSYVVTVGVSDGTLTDSIEVTIDVDNVNEAPTFPPATATTLEIAENTAANTDIGDAFTATGFDATKHDRYILEGDDAASFSIGSSTGQLTTSAALDYETQNSYSVIVTIQRGIEVGGVATYPDDVDANSVTVTISITNKNEAPAFATETTTRSVAENTAAGTNIGTAVAAADPDIAGTNTDANPETTDADALTYTLSGTDAASFDIVSTSGQLQTKAALDFETDDEYEVTVTASDGTLSNSINVTINITNVNETLSFPDSTDTTLEVTKHIAVGADIGMPIAAEDTDVTSTNTDVNPDDGTVDALSYTLGGTDVASFDIDTATGQLKAKEGVVFNRKIKSSYTVSVTAWDGEFSVSITVDIAVIMTPVCARTPAVRDAIVTAVQVSEPSVTDCGDVTETHLGAITSLDVSSESMTALKAGDFDGLSALTTLYLNDNQLETLPENVFDELTKLTWLDLHSNQLSTLNVDLFDGRSTLEHIDLSGNQLSELDVNLFDGLTALERLILSGNQLSTLEENLFDGLTALEQLNLSSNQLSTLEENLFDGLTALEQLNLSSNQFSTLEEDLFDGLTALIELNLGSNQFSTVPTEIFEGLTTLTRLFLAGNTVDPLRLMVLLEKVADGEFKASVPTGAPFVISLSFSVTNGTFDGGLTSAMINIPTGSLESISFTVTRTEGTTDDVTVNIGNLPGLPANHDGYELAKSADLPLTVLPAVANNAPVFDTGLNTTPSIAENTVAGTNIGTPLTATDADTTDTVTYSIDATSDAVFDIESSTGQLKTEAALDYEDTNSYSVTVEASDGTDTASITVTVSITDVNEAPTFPSTETGTRTIAENTAANTNIGVAIGATDPDTADGDTDVNPATMDADTLTYTLTGTDAASFAIVSTSGQLQTKDALDYETKDSYSVTVGVSDGTLTDSIEVTIDVDNVNEAPTFPPATDTTLEIAENTVANTNIGTAITATGFDATKHDRYILEGDDAASFSIGSSTGQLTTSAVLDYETQSSYTVIVTVQRGIEVSGVATYPEGVDANSITVTISITNVNEAPAFPPTTDTTLEIAENTAAGTNIGTVVAATDPDVAGTNTDANPETPDSDTLTYTLGGTDAASFDIVGTSGQLQTKAALDYENKDEYEVTVTASDGTLSASIEITIDITDVLVFTDGDSTTRAVAENTAAGENIGTAVTATGTGGTLTYSLTGTDAASFDIDTGTGQLQTKVALDYEIKNSYSVTVGVTEGTETASITVAISITNVNEAPVFPDSTDTTLEIAENTAAGTNIGDAVAATDPDIAGTNTDANPETPDADTLTYTLSGTDAASFSIVSTGGQLQTSAALDYETKDSYVVTVGVSDGTLTDSIEVTIDVDNVNEAPTFNTGLNTTPSIAENTVAGTNIGTPLTATDVDTTDTLTYSIDATDDAVFDIESSTGQLKTEAALDYEDTNSYTVTVTVSDGTNDATIDVTISIPNVNEAPEFATDTATRSIAENTAANTNIGTAVTATDPDIAGTNTDANPETSDADTLTYTLTGTDAASFSIVSTSGQLQTKVALDFETDDEYEVTVTASDGTLSASIGVTISITDVLVFTDGDRTTRSVAENTAASENIGTAITATGTGGTLTYSLTGTDAASFDIDTGTGQLQTKVALDYETKNSYSVTVGVTEGTETASITVTINIIDVNEAPTFPPTTDTTLEIAENTAANTNIGDAVAATDPDTADSDTDVNPTDVNVDSLTYSLDATSDAVFNIDNTGQLKTEAALDYEGTNSYTVTVTASDGEHSASIEITIDITDVDEVTPNSAPTFPSTTDTTLEIAENTAAGTDIGAAVIATDTDIGDTLTYSIDATSDTVFDIESSTGQLKTEAALDYEDTNSYSVTVTVSDGTDTASITVTISITNVNEAPAFASETTIRSVAENTAASQNIGTAVTATDPDIAGTNTDANPETSTADAVIYTLGGTDAASFAIVSTSGQLQTKAALDFETDDEYEVTVTASDGTLSNSIDVTINITDVLVFTDGNSTTRSVAENTAASENIGTAVTATGAGGTLTYSLTGTDAASFDIDTGTGQLQTKVALDYEVKNSYSVTVGVTEGTETASITVAISITNVNEAPSFPDSTDTTLEIAENTAAGTNIGDAVAATDPDIAGTNTDANPETSTADTLTYSIDATSDTVFDIDSTGQLKTQAALDYETTDSYTVTVTASDGALSASITVTITVTDVDEDRPTVTVTDVPSTTQNGQFEVTITFSEAVTLTGSGNITTVDSVSRTYSLSGNGTTYTATFSRVEGKDGTIKIKVPAGLAKDSADNENTESGTHTVTVDWKDPTVTVTVPSGTQTAAFDVTISFSESVTGFEASDISLTGTASATATLTGSGTTYTANITPTSSGNVVIQVPADAAEDGAGNGNTESQSHTVAVSLPAPTVTITGVPTTPQNSAFDITIAFSETVTGFAASDISLGNNVSATASLTGSGTTYTATITPAANVEEQIVISVPAGAAQNAANTDNTASAEHRVQLDTVKPSVALTAPSGTQTGAFNVTITFSETVTGFVQGDISLSGTATATVTSFTGSGRTYTAEITPTTSGNVNINVDADVAADTAENGNTAATQKTVRVLIEIDMMDPVDPPVVEEGIGVLLAVFQDGEGIYDLSVTGTFELLISFRESMTGFEQSDLQVLGQGKVRDASNLITGWRGPIQESGFMEYYATITPKVSGSLIFRVPAGVAHATDGGQPNVKVQLLVKVRLDTTITQPNRPPAFSSGSTTRSVAENTAANQNIGNPVSATDQDNDPLTYSLKAHTDDADDYLSFDIDTTSAGGQLKTSAALDYETQSSYKVTVEVSDGRGGTDTIDVTINITDVDETLPNNAPVFTEGTSTTRSVAENTAANQNIGIPVSATDQDNDPLTYSLRAHTDDADDYLSFDIDTTSAGGQLKTSAALDYETQSSYKVTVEVSDGRGGTDTINVTITVTDVDETLPNNAPTFTEGTSTTRSVAENTAANQNIGNPVSATDQDNDPLTYSLKAHTADADDYQAFSIATSTGQLKTSAALDYETQSSYKVTVEVSDGRGGTDTINVTITVTDVDETPPNNAPTFTEGTSTTRPVAEDTATNQNIGSPVSATDQDNDPLTYSLKAHNADADDYQAFSIATSTGQLKTSAALDYETQSSYKVTVEVSDGRGGTDTINVTINVTDVDEAPPNSAPVFTSDSTTRSIGETTRAGVKIGAPVTATDPDGDTLTYSLEGTDAASFNIDRSTGQLKTKAALDRNIKRRYTVIVKASDGKGGTDTITVTINVRKPDRPQPIMVVSQNGVEEQDQVVKPGTFQLIMEFDQPVTGFDRSDLKIHDFRTGATFSGWQGSSGGTEYTATFTGASEGVITFTVPENAAQAADDGQGNAEWKLTVWVTESGEHNLGAPMGGKEIPYPDVTLLLSNYPNPFNPETWIPYQLAHDADVEIRIYDVRGTVVRRLALGHQSAGFYTNRTRAAYWDGRNSFGEDVANGVYFYQLRASDISPLRKMLMLK